MTKYLDHYLILAISSFFYIFTLAPTIIGGDSASFCMRVHHSVLRFGSADSHPLHILLGKAFALLPFELALSMNLLSAFSGTLTVFLVFLIIKHITNSDFSAFFGSLSLMVSHTFWLHSVIAEVYTLNTFFLALLIYLAVTKHRHKGIILTFPAIFILGLTNHLILMISLPPFLVYFLMNADPKRRRNILIVTGNLLVLCLLIALWLYVYHFDSTFNLINDYIKGPPSIKVYLLPPADFIKFFTEFVFYVLYLLYQYPAFGIIIGSIGIVRLFQKKWKIAVLLLLLILFNGFFFIKTTAWKSFGGTKYTFYIPDYVVFSIFLGYGSLSLFKWINSFSDRCSPLLKKIESKSFINILITLLFIGSTIGFYALMPRIVTSLGLDLVHARTLPYRDNNKYFFNPNKRGYYGDRQLGEKILKLAEKDAVIFADHTIFTILKYLIDIEKIRPDIKLVKVLYNKKFSIHRRVVEIRKNNPDTHIYIADNNKYYKPKEIKKKHFIKKVGPFFEVVPKNKEILYNPK